MPDCDQVSPIRIHEKKYQEQHQMIKYQHTQAGTLIRFALGIPSLGLVSLSFFVLQPASFIMAFAGAILGLSALLFHSLSVSMDEKYLHVKMGIGLIRTKIPLSEISDAYQVKNKWYHGFGIHALDKGFIFNVSGMKAVEIVLKSGKILRIGTDEPKILAGAINGEISK